MANKIQVRRGNKADLPVLSPGEPGLVLDDKELYFGTLSGNLQIATAAQLEDIEQQIIQELGKMVISPLNYGAVGDGVTNDTEAFTLLEASYTGIEVDLVGKTFVVDAIPDKNFYFNGVFKVSGNTRRPILDIVPKYHAFGGQLAKLKESLANPLEQITGIVFIGDSITWGRALDENAVSVPRDGTLSDPRDNFASPSFVNTFKRYIGSNYAFNATPVLSNWSFSTSGESTVEYTVNNVMYPKDGDFTLTTTGTGTSVTEAAAAGSITGFQLLLGITSGGTGVHTVGFNFTGDRFTYYFGATVNAADYELIVDGVSQGIFSATPGVDGVVAGNNNQREHVFDYVRNKTVQIRTSKTAYSGVQYLKPEGISVNKIIRITNQGIIGTFTERYKNWNLSGEFGDGIAVGPQDNYVFCMIGTNDRGIDATKPKGSNYYLKNLADLIDVVLPLSDVILMSANPVVNEDPAVYSFNMQVVRNVTYRVGVEKNLDMIDHYTVFNGIDIGTIAGDGLHPNNLGHQIIARNIISALEMA